MAWARCNRNGLVALALLMLALPAAAQEELTVSKVYIGNVTFGSSGQAMDVSATGNPMIRLADNPALGTRKELIFTLDTSADTARIQSIQQTVAYRPLLLNPNGGNLGLGTATASYPITAGGTVAPVTGYSYDLGAYLKKFLTIHAAELRVETLVAADVMATIGGRINVAPTTQLTADLAAGDTTMYVKHNNLAAYDRVRLEANGNVEGIAIGAGGCTGGSAPYTCAAIGRNFDGSGANDWYAGDAVLNTGLAGDGYIDLYSDRSTRSTNHYGPTIVGNVRTGTGWMDLEERWAIGNLRGLFGYSTSADEFGSAFGSPSASWLKIDPTNGLRMGNGANVKVSITPAGTATFTGDGSGVTSINGANLQTGSITANKIALSPAYSGAALNRDPNFLDSTVWASQYQINNTLTDGKVGTVALQNTANAYLWGYDSRLIPIDPTKTYRAHAWVRKTAGTGSDATYLWISQRDSTGAMVDETYATGCPNTYNPIPASWTLCEGQIGNGTSYPFHASARYVYVGYGLNNAQTSSVIQMQDLRFEEKSPASLIVDGTITATQIAANTITGDKIAANTITAADIAAGTITATEITGTTLSVIASDLGSVTAGSIVVGGPTNYLWLNDSGDAALNIGGATKTAAPFRVSAAGALTAWSGYFGDASSDVTLSASGIAVGSTGTISAGGGDVSLTNAGLNLTTGNGSNNQVKWSDGSYIGSYNDAMFLYGEGSINFDTYNASVWLDNARFSGDYWVDLGANTERWHDFWLEDDFHHFGDYYWDSPPTTDSADYPIVWSSSSKALYRKTGNISNTACGGSYGGGDYVASISVANGLVVATSCAYFSPDELQAELKTVKAEVADLKAHVAALLALLGGKQ